MSDDPIDDPQDLPDTATDAATDAAPSASDARDATIEQLERTLADERQNSAALRSTIEGLNFKIKMLEQGYSKQLEDARLRTEAAEREVADHQARMTSLDTAHEDAMQLLTKAQAELDSLTAARSPSRKQPTSTDGSRIEAMAHDSPESEGQENLSIDELMDDQSWARKRLAKDNAKAELEAEEDVGQESPLEEMITPDWLYARKDADNDES